MDAVLSIGSFTLLQVSFLLSRQFHLPMGACNFWKNLYVNVEYQHGIQSIRRWASDEA